MMIKFAYFLYGLNYFLSNRYINIWVFLKYNLKSLTKISTKIFRGHDSVTIDQLVRHGQERKIINGLAARNRSPKSTYNLSFCKCHVTHKEYIILRTTFISLNWYD